MIFGHSMARRLTSVLLLATVCLSLSTLLVVNLVVQHEVDEVMDEGLRESAELVHDLLSAHWDRYPLLHTAPPLGLEPGRFLAWQILGPDGQVLARSPEAPAAALVPYTLRGFHSPSDAWRVYALPFPQRDALMVAAQKGAERYEARADVAHAASLTIVVVGLIFCGLLVVLTRRELSPLVKMSDAISAAHPDDHRIDWAGSHRDELRPIQEAIDGLTCKLKQRIETERMITAHAAHALRTPLASLVIQIAAAQAQATGGERQALDLANRSATQLRRVVPALLTLFRSGADLRREPVRLCGLLGGLELPTTRVIGTDGLVQSADPDLLYTVAINLYDNAVKHRATTFTITLVSTPGYDVLHFADNGVGLAPEKAQVLQQALREKDYTPMGLGLMLADVVATAHGGHVQLGEGFPGFCIGIALPRQPPGSASAAS